MPGLQRQAAKGIEGDRFLAATNSNEVMIVVLVELSRAEELVVLVFQLVGQKGLQTDLVFEDKLDNCNF